MRILIAYASVYGSTAEVARFMGEALQAEGHEVAVESVKDVSCVDHYDAVIMGSAVHAGLMLPEMFRFIRRFRPLLAAKQIYLWVTCIRVLEPGGYEHALINYIPEDIVQSLNVRALQAFAGKHVPDAIPMSEYLMLADRYDGWEAANAVRGDFRDWGAINAWAKQVADDLAGV
jgi:menaquinone-dependent protoporphyrinogen oxidase